LSTRSFIVRELPVAIRLGRLTLGTETPLHRVLFLCSQLPMLEIEAMCLQESWYILEVELHEKHDQQCAWN
jgi:hypothetical protein